jgi:hypothetical protein
MGGKGDPGQGPGTGSEARIRELEAQLQQSASEIDGLRRDLNAVMRDQGLEHAIGDATQKLERIFAPLRAIAPERRLDEAEGQLISQLRASLARADLSDAYDSGERLPADHRPYSETAA